MTIVINGTTGISGVDGSAATPAVQGTDTNTGVFYPAADTVGLATNGTERMRVDASGNVGVGTTSPSSYGLFTVLSTTAGSAKINITDNSAGSAAPLLQFGVNSSNGFNTADAARIWTTASTSSVANLNFAAYNGGAPSTAQMVLTGGSVGIGTTSPTNGKLVITGSAVTTAQGIRLTGDTADARFICESATIGAGILGTFSNHSQLFYTNSTERMRIDSSGNLLVGTTTAQTGAVLAVTGGIQGTIKSGTAVASTSGTSIDFTGLPSWVKRITVMFNGVSTNGASSYLVQIGNSGGIVSTGYNSTSIETNSTSGTGGTSSTAGFVIFSNSASLVNSGHIVLTNVSGSVWVSSHTLKGLTTVIHSGGGDGSVSTLDRVRITTVNGTDAFDAGSINILYEG